MHKLIDIQLDQALAEHYLFDLDLTVDKVAEVLDMDKDYVKGVYEQSSRLMAGPSGVSHRR